MQERNFPLGAGGTQKPRERARQPPALGAVSQQHRAGRVMARGGRAAGSSTESQGHPSPQLSVPSSLPAAPRGFRCVLKEALRP